MLHRLPAAIYILEIGACEAADRGVFGPFRDFLHRLEITFGSDREAGLDDVHPHFIEHLRDLELFLMGHGGAGALFAIAQGGIEDQDSFLFRGFCHGFSL